MEAYPQVVLAPGSTSYFRSRRITSTRICSTAWICGESVRRELLGLLMDTLVSFSHNPAAWVKLWLAGSGASYQWVLPETQATWTC